MATSEERHTADVEQDLGHHEAGSTEGGKCLNRHKSREKNNSCAHIWQAFEKTKLKRALYDWPVYRGATKCKRAFRHGEGFTFSMHPAPGEKEWDVDKPNPRHDSKHNFAVSSSVPYYHEAHHLVPNSTLNSTLNELFSENEPVRQAVRKGLLEESYNLNHKDNMINLPLDVRVSQAIKLPRHREFNEWCHSEYSKKVETELKKAFNTNKAAVEKHDAAPKYKATKAKIVKLSKSLFERIVAAGKAGVSKLDKMSDGQVGGT